MSRVLRIAVCEWCNSEFGLADLRHRFCGRSCASKWRRSLSLGLKDRDARFKSKMAPPNENGCRLWTAGSFSDGYGAFKTKGKLAKAHRYAWELVNGQVPDGLLVCHTCDVPACCEITHLWLGTNAENMHDMVEKGRSAKGDRNASRMYPGLSAGESNGKARLQADDIRRIREQAAAGTPRKVLAENYGVGVPHICSIVLRKNWKHVA